MYEAVLLPFTGLEPSGWVRPTDSIPFWKLRFVGQTIELSEFVCITQLAMAIGNAHGTWPAPPATATAVASIVLRGEARCSERARRSSERPHSRTVTRTALAAAALTSAVVNEPSAEDHLPVSLCVSSVVATLVAVDLVIGWHTSRR
jgi:hypothetical protein